MTISHPVDPGKALWVSAHPRPGSLNAHLRRAGTAALAERYDVATSDLYAQGFDPRLSESDLDGEAVPDDVRVEQEKIATAGLLVLQFPLWWYGVPAMLKGWFDRVLTEGFAYGDMDPESGLPRRYGDSGLSGRRALIVVTAGDDARTLGPRGVSGDLDSLLFSVTHGTLWYVGIESLPLHVIHDADEMTADGVERETARLVERIRGIDAEPARRFRRLADGDYHGTRSLRDDVHPDRIDLGIHTL